MKVLLDLNVLVDLFLKRPPWINHAAIIWAAHQAGRITIGIAASSLPTLYYLIRRGVDRTTAEEAVRDCLNGAAFWKVDAATLASAMQQPGADFEDNLQIACAVEAKADAIVTRDPAGFAHSPIPVLTPSALAARLASGTP